MATPITLSALSAAAKFSCNLAVVASNVAHVTSNAVGVGGGISGGGGSVNSSNATIQNLTVTGVLTLGSNSIGFAGQAPAQITADAWSFMQAYVYSAGCNVSPALTRALFKGVAQDHSAYLEAGNLFVFGRNDRGQLGLGHTSNVAMPTQVPGVSNAAAVACGQSFTVVVLATGAAVAAGANDYGQLGDGTTVTQSNFVAVQGVSNAVAVGAGYTHAAYCLSNASGGVIAGYGGNAVGQLGNGAQSVTNTSLVYAAMPTLGGGASNGSNARDVDCGSYHTVMLLNNGSAWSCGSNGEGQCALGSNTAPALNILAPAQVPGLTQVVSAACGEAHTALVRWDGGVWCAGRNNAGQCGVGAASAAPCYGVSNVVAAPSGSASNGAGLNMVVSAGAFHTAATRYDGAILVWGSNNVGQLGAGTGVGSYAAPTRNVLQYSTTATAYSVACGRNHTVWLLNNDATEPQKNRIVATGDNTYGQMGDYVMATVTGAAVTARYTPVPISEGSVVLRKRLQGSANQAVITALVDADGTLYVGGANSYGGLGDGSTAGKSNLQPVGTFGTRAITAVAPGQQFTVAVDATGDVHTWGYNASSQLGNGASQNSSASVNVSGNGSLAGQTTVAIAAGNSHTLALDTTGAVHAWGTNANGELGVNDVTTRTTPVVMSGGGSLAGRAVVAMSAGASHNVACDSTGAVHTWGLNASGQLGVNDVTTRSNAVNISANGSLAGKTVVAVAAGGSHTLALDASGAAHAWGNNASGQLGINATAARSNPVVVSSNGSLSGRTVIAIAAGNSHTLALDATGAVHAWGVNGVGQLGTGDLANRSNPLLISSNGSLSGRTVVAIATGGDHSLALDATGAVHVWGYGNSGRLGQNDLANRSNPTLLASNVRDYYRAAGVVFSDGGLGDHKLMMNRSNASNLLVIGNNSNGQLGDGTATSRSNPTAGPTFTSNVIAAANGWNHSAAVLADGRVYLWGRNHRGQCGSLSSNNAASNILTPALLAGVGNATDVACGSNCTLVRLADGTVQALGGNGNYQLGVGPDVVGGGGTWAPVVVPNLLNVTALASGGGAGLAADAAGRVWAWGTHSNGSTGCGTSNGAMSNPAVLDGSNFGYGLASRVAMGDGHAAVVTTAGRLYTCGMNDVGQLGVASNYGTSNPVAVWQRVLMTDGSSNAIIDVACGAKHTVAHLANGTVRVFGDNTAGQLGNDAKNSYASCAPIVNAFTGGVVAVSAALSATLCESVNRSTRNVGGTYPVAGQLQLGVGCAADYMAVISPAGQLYLWGLGTDGQLGVGDQVTRSNSVCATSAFAASSLYGKTVSGVALGTNFCVAIDSTGAVHTWGGNAGGQLGMNKTATRSLTPSNVTALGGNSLAGQTVVAVAAGWTHALAVDAAGCVHSWGVNTYGQLGTNDTTGRSNPVNISKLAGSALAGRTVVAVAGGIYNSYALDSVGQVYAWGYGLNYGHGLGDTLDRSNPTAVPTLVGKSVTAISAGNGFAMALEGSGTLYAWGLNNYGQLGLNHTLTQPTPGAVPGTGWTAVSCGYQHTLAQQGSILYCTGYNAYGQLITGSLDTVTRSNLTSYVNSAKYGVIAATLNDTFFGDTGMVWGVGNTASGQLNNNSVASVAGTIFYTNASTYGALSNAALSSAPAITFKPFTVNFTGQHRVFVAGADPRTQEGFVVVCDRNDYAMDAGDGGGGIVTGAGGGAAWVRGKRAMTINDALPLVSIAAKAYDKRVFGVVSTKTEALSSADAARDAQTDAQLARLREHGDVRVQINALGEGCLWVCDAGGGALESGDYVTSSDVPGYAMKQTSEFQANYTVAKLTRDCDFTAPLQPALEVQRDANGLVLLDAAAGGQPLWAQATAEARVWRDEATGEPDASRLVTPEDLAAMNVDEIGQKTALVQAPATEPAYDMRWLLADGTSISRSDYAARKAAGEAVYRAAFLGCTYHCG